MTRKIFELIRLDGAHFVWVVAVSLLALPEARAANWRTDPHRINNCVHTSQQCCPGCNPNMAMGGLGQSTLGVAVAINAASLAVASAEALLSDDPNSKISANATATALPGDANLGSAIAALDPKALEAGRAGLDGKEGLAGVPGVGGAGSPLGSGTSSGGANGNGGSFFDRLLGLNKTDSAKDPSANGLSAKTVDGEAAGSGQAQSTASQGWSMGGEVRSPASVPSSGGTGLTEFANGNAAVNPMGTIDPEDYFARTAIDLSLFKVVERRYQRQYVTWKTSANPSQRARKLAR
ncbi:MAG: hypothetical protein ACK5QT_02950 [Oligoflexia bacterium]|jgi:hypothetical protein